MMDRKPGKICEVEQACPDGPIIFKARFVATTQEVSNWDARDGLVDAHWWDLMNGKPLVREVSTIGASNQWKFKS